MARIAAKDLEAGAIAPRRGEVEVPPPVSRLRRASTLAALLVMAAALFGIGLRWTAQPVFIMGYEAHGTELVVQYSPAGSCDALVRRRASETDRAVILDMAALKPIPGVPRTSIAYICSTTFQLKEPLGDRELRLADGRTVEQAWAATGR